MTNAKEIASQEKRLQVLWGKASAQPMNAPALAALREAFEANALEDFERAELLHGVASVALGSRYYTKKGKRRTCGGRPVFSHTGSYGVDSYACSLDDEELLRASSAVPGILSDLKLRRPAGWGTTSRNLRRDLTAYRGEIRRRGL